MSRGGVDADAMRDLLIRNAPGGNDADRPTAFAVDQSVWPRWDAEASPGRGYYYHPSRHSGVQPIVAGWAYQLVAGLSFERDSWVGRLPRHAKAPLFVFDAGYDPVRLQLGLEGCRAQVLVRLHSGYVSVCRRAGKGMRKNIWLVERL